MWKIWLEEVEERWLMRGRRLGWCPMPLSRRWRTETKEKDEQGSGSRWVLILDSDVGQRWAKVSYIHKGSLPIENIEGIAAFIKKNSIRALVLKNWSSPQLFELKFLKKCEILWKRQSDYIHLTLRRAIQIFWTTQFSFLLVITTISLRAAHLSELRKSNKISLKFRFKKFRNDSKF